MNVLAVSGTGSNSGKTTLIVAILRAFPGWGGLKASPVEPGAHEHPLASDYEFVTGLDRLMSPSTDTHFYIEAGAMRAAWLVARPPLSDRAIAEVRAHFAPCAGLAVEGGSLADPLGPGRRYVIARAGVRSFKPGAAAAAARADALLVNAPAGTPTEEANVTAAALAAYGAKAPIVLIDPATPDDPGLRRVLGEVRAWARC